MKKEDVKVSVLCTAYNHEKFLRMCLDGFVMQKTNFKFEVIIHDDASTDGTKKIIEEYVEKYPDIIIPIYQTENQYSKGIEIIDTIMFPLSKGKYIALCEGDDYWCDENKLQLQYDFMENHPDCAACFHNSLRHDLLNTKEDILFNDWENIHYLTPYEVINGYYVHTSSYFQKRENFLMKDYQRDYWFGDYVRLTGALLDGQLAVLPQVMSVYNSNNQDGVTADVYNINDIEKYIKKISQIIEYLNKFDNYSKGKFKKEILEKINSVSYLVEVLTLSHYVKINKSNNDIRKQRLSIKKHINYKSELKKLNLINKLKMIVKFNIPTRIYKIIARKKYRKNGK